MADPIRVLLVEDDEDDYVITRDLLTDINPKGYQLTWSKTFEAGMESLVLGNPEVVLVDYRLGQHTGVEFLTQARQRGHHQPLIMLTGEGDDVIDRQAMEAGASDYLVKGQISAVVLERSIRYALEQSRTLQAMRTAEREYRTIFEQSAEGLFRATRTGRMVLANPMMAVLFGYSSADELLNQWYDEGIGLAERLVEPKRWAELMRQLDKRGMVTGQELQIKDGESELWVSLSLRLPGETTGSERLVEGTLQDITEHKQAEAEMAKLVASEATRAEVERSLDRFKFLDEVSRQLSTTLDYEATLSKIAGLAVPFLAEWAAVYVVDDRKRLRRLPPAIDQATWRQVADQMTKQYMAEEVTGNRLKLITAVLQSGRPQLISMIDEAWYAQVALNDTHLKLLKSVKPSSHIVVPLQVGERCFGAISLMRCAGSLPYTELDLALAEEFSRRVAQEVDRSRLYSLAQAEIAERKKAQASLRKSEERYQAFVAQSSEGIWRFEAKTPIDTTLPVDDQIKAMLRHMYLAECNDSLAHMYGYATAGEMIGRRLGELVETDDVQMLDHFKLFIEHGYRLNAYETLEPASDGSWRFFQNNMVGMVEKETLVRLWGTQLDVSIRKRAERDLAKSYNLLQSVVEGTSDWVTVKDEGGKYILVNPGMLRALDMSEGEVLGKTDIELFGPEAGAAMWQTDQRVMAAGKPETVEETIQIKDQKRTVLSARSVYRDQNGKVIGVIDVSRDISQRIEVERQKDEFLGIASHELKTPVTSLKAFTQILQRRFNDEADGDAKRYLAKMDNQMNRLTGLINELLDVTKIQSGRLEFHLTEFDLTELVKEVVDDFEHISDQHRLEMQVSGSAMVMADRERVGQIILNLLSNAVKYSPEADRVKVHLERAKDRATLAVTDFGLGINPDEQVHVFERFYRSQSGVQTISGLGLGLYISKEIAERHRGTLEVESQPGLGSTFRLSLPVATAAPAMRGSVEAIKPAKTVPHRQSPVAEG